MGSDCWDDIQYYTRTISIHAPRVGSDLISGLPEGFNVYFNPRSPCGERRCATMEASATVIFQSTLPVWGATIGDTVLYATENISIHAPRVGSDIFRNNLDFNFAISIHAPRVGSDHRRAPGL